MGKTRKFATLMLIVALIALNPMIAQAYTEDSIAKPSIPEFTVTIVAHPYDVPPKTTTTIDQYTGKETTTTQAGYRVENKSIEIRIKNIQFTPYSFIKSVSYNIDDGGTYTVDRNYTVNLYYDIGVKGHFGNDWTRVGSSSYPPRSNAQSDSEYTVISIGADYPDEAVLDFRVQACFGYYVAYGRNAVIFGYDFYGQESGYGSIQTLKMGEVGATAVPDKNQPTPTPTTQQTPMPTPTTQQTPTPTPTAPQQTSTPTQNPPTQTPTAISFSTKKLLTIAAVAAIGALLLAAIFLKIITNRRKNS